MNRSLVADAVDEAFGTYMGWKTYHHAAAGLVGLLPDEAR